MKIGIKNAADLRTAVLNAYPAQMTEINALFDSYGYLKVTFVLGTLLTSLNNGLSFGR